jgi:transcriptional regulator with XRE-family HTH domain
MKSGIRHTREFAARLRALMIERGYVSESARSGVDLNALAKAADTSYEMARRYAEGIAAPRADKMAMIAAWLGVAPGLLLWGDKNTNAIDAEALQACIRAVTEAQARTGQTLSTDRAARLVALLYEETMAGRNPTPATIDLMIRAT